LKEVEHYSVERSGTLQCWKKWNITVLKEVEHYSFNHRKKK